MLAGSALTPPVQCKIDEMHIRIVIITGYPAGKWAPSMSIGKSPAQTNS